MPFRNPTKLETLKRGLLWMIVVGGILAMLWPVSHVAFGWWNQRALRQEWAAQLQAAQSESNLPKEISVSHSSTSIRARSQRAQPKRKPQPQRWLPTRLVIPDIDVDAIVVRGVDVEALKRGPGHDPASALPGQKGNCVIAAHRNAYGWWFYRLNRLGDGSLIELRTPRETLQYKVASTQVLPDTATWALQAPPSPHAAPRLTLYTCALPHGSDRIVVTANLVRRAPP